MTGDLSEWCTRIVEAGNRIYELAQPTPVAAIEDNQRLGSGRAFLKLEHLQKTGSFKLRGATNKVLSLAPQEASKGVITSSTGNHALGVATAARYRGIGAEVFVCSQVSPEKLHLIEASGARIRCAGNTPLEAELVARAAAVASGKTYISPYNDRDVIAGQGTIGIEVVKQVDSIDALYIAVGGGGLIGGVGAYIKSVSPQTEIVGCWPQNSRVMYECLCAGQVIDFPEQPTLSESTAGGVEPGSITFDLCQQVIDRCVLVSEPEILEAMRWAHQRRWKVEGAAGVAIAAFFKDVSKQQARTVVIISCGGNTSSEVLTRLNNPGLDQSLSASS
jgi:threonine dehydratase